MRVRPCLLVIFGLAVALTSSEQACCEKKEVGGKNYTLATKSSSVPPECKNSCIYTEDENPGNSVCFAPGYLSSTCLAQQNLTPIIEGTDCGGIFCPYKCPNYNVQCSTATSLQVGPVTTWTTPAQCGRECQSKGDACKAWTMIPKDPTPPNATCYFLSNCYEEQDYEGRISGFWGCPPVKDRYNSNGTLSSCPVYDKSCIARNNLLAPTVGQTVTTPDECGLKCRYDPRCIYWTMVPNFLPPADCYVLSSCEDAVPKNRSVSGSYSCPP